MGEMLELVISDENMQRALGCLNLSACSGIDRQRPRSLVDHFSLSKDKLKNRYGMEHINQLLYAGYIFLKKEKITNIECLAFRPLRIG